MEGAEAIAQPRGRGQARDAWRDSAWNRWLAGNSRVVFRDGVLALLTAALVILGLLSVRQQWVYRPPSDNAQWIETPDGVWAARVALGGAAWQAGIRPGDRLIAADGTPISHPEDLTRMIFAAGAGRTVAYAVLRNGALRIAPITLGEAASHGGRYLWEDLVGLLYLVIGLFIWLGRHAAHKGLHFYLFCVASFVLYTFHFTGKLNAFDWTVFWANEVALLLVPCLFLHFALAFPKRKGLFFRYPVLLAAVYVPAALMLALQAGVAAGAVTAAAPTMTLQSLLDRLAYALFALAFTAGTVALYHTYRHAAATALRPQMKWIAGGAALALAPFFALYVIPYLAGVDLPRWSSLAVVSLVLIPLTFAYAILRHRLMDVDILFRRGVAYSLATMAVVGVYFAVIALAAALIHARVPRLGAAGWILAILVTAIVFEPAKGWLQEKMDRLFYRERYDYRRTLLEFGRRMNAEPELEPLLAQVLERLEATLSVERIAIFIASAEGGFRLARARGLGVEPPPPAALRFLDPAWDGYRSGRLFFESPSRPLQSAPLEPAEQRAVTALDLNYYLPCQLQGRTVAVVGLGKTREGDYLSSQDVELVETLAGSLAIAIENAQLYARLREQARENERLKEFNENIVQSVAVGVAAVGRDDRIESWNARMEALAGVPAAAALGQPVAEVLGEEWAREYRRARPIGEVANIYKRRLVLGAAGERVVNLAFAPLMTRQFEIVGQIILIEDISDQIALEQKLARAERLSSVGLLAAGVAHEVNTPLAVIANYTQMLAKQFAPGDPRSPIVDKITRQTFRASEIVGNLLNFSRTGGGEMSEIDLNAVVRDTLALMEHPLNAARVHVMRELAADLPPIQGHGGRLQQVLLNLLLNARDAMPGGGWLRIATKASPEGVRLEVADSGVGITPESRDRIFDPFFTTKKAQPGGQNFSSAGAGLGLAVTYGIVREHGGTISVESHPGQGACFQMEFPALRRVAHA